MGTILSATARRQDLLDRLRARTLRVAVLLGGALVSPVHANFLVNRRGARASDILGLIHDIKTRVRERNGVDLELEIKVWPSEA